MKCMLAQINTTVGALDGNLRKVLETLDRAREMKVDLVLFPELTLTGYPPKDLLNRTSFVSENLARLEKVVEASRGLCVVVGYVARRTEGDGKGLYNAAATIRDGRIVARHFKTLIPTYDVFDEGRYFDSAEAREPVVFDDLRLGVTICEDCWNDQLYWSRRLYDIDPVEDLVGRGLDAIVNISASPFNLGRIATRHDMFAATARRHKMPLIHVNLVGGNDGLLFDGSSAVFGPDGRARARAKSFAEDLLVFDWDVTTSTTDAEAPPDEEMEELRRALAMGTRDYVRKCRFDKVLVGLSGGIDSAVTCAVAADALGPENVYGVSMPSRYSSEHSKGDAALLAENLGVDHRVIPIEPAFQAFMTMLDPSFGDLPADVTEENIQARIRGVTLMALSNKFGAMVLTTGNKSEVAVGYATLYGDMCGGLGPISDVPKVMVYRLARWFNRDGEVIPESSIAKPPSAELRPEQRDTDSLPEYETLDPILRAYVEEDLDVNEICERLGEDRKLVERIARMIDRAEYKRQQAAPGLRVTTKAFGYGRRMPIAAYD